MLRGIFYIGAMGIAWQKIVPNGGRVFIGGGACVPFALVNDLLSQYENFHDVELCHVHTLGDIPWVDPKYKGAFRTNTFFMSRSIRGAVETGQADYTPSPTSDIPRLFEVGALKLDVALVQVSPPDENGMASLGLSADVICSAIKNAKVVIAQVNKYMPRTQGDTVVSMKKFKYVITHHEKLVTKDKWIYSDEHQQAARYAAQLIDDGATIQASLGNSPQAVLSMLHKHKNLGIHTGCFTNGMMRLMKAGAVDNSMKAQQRGLSVASHVLGSKELYQFIRETNEISMHRSEYTNDPNRIGKIKNMVAINGAREVDLTGQVVRDSRGHHFYGGIGATQDFIRGASMSKGGRPIIVLTSTAEDGSSSRIVAGLTSGSGVCTSRGDVHYVVTEYGVANLLGQSIRQRALRLVEVAHPKFRENLLEEARELGWLPKIFSVSPTNMNLGGKEIDLQKAEFGGMKYVVRPLHPSDLRLLQRFFYTQDEETLRLRFGHDMPELDESSAYSMTSVAQDKDLALGVFYENKFNEELRATGRFYLDAGGESAEVSFLVHEKARRMGIANFLLGEMAKVAVKRGVKKFWASVLKRNKSMSQLFLNMGAERKVYLGEDSDEFWMDTSKLVKASKSFKKKKDKLDSKVSETKKKNDGLGIYRSENLLRHETGPMHPESVERYKAVLDMLSHSRFKSKKIKGRRAQITDITLAHSPDYHDLTRYDIDNFAEVLRTGDTSICEDSYDVVMEATGGVLSAVDQVMSGEINRAFCAVRPPGHHASRAVGMGFCIFNHVAIAARYAQKTHGIERVAILDWDVHHGNGTQDIFYEDGSVFYFSTHEDGIFPHTGHASETGAKKGKNTTFNIPLKAGAGDAQVIEAWNAPLYKKLKRFKPDLILVSAGFDAAEPDPLGDFKMTPDGFSQLTTIVRGYADEFCNGRLVSVLEGGYNPQSLADCIKAHLKAMR